MTASGSAGTTIMMNTGAPTPLQVVPLPPLPNDGTTGGPLNPLLSSQPTFHGVHTTLAPAQPSGLWAAQRPADIIQCPSLKPALLNFFKRENETYAHSNTLLFSISWLHSRRSCGNLRIGPLSAVLSAVLSLVLASGAAADAIRRPTGVRASGKKMFLPFALSMNLFSLIFITNKCNQIHLR